MEKNTAQTAYLPEAQFEAEVLKSKQPVLAVFETPWSRPCQVLDPVVQELANDWAGSVKVVRVNADDSLDLSLCYDIQSIPTLLFFAEGTLRLKVVGTATKDAILTKLKASGFQAEEGPENPGPRCRGIRVRGSRFAGAASCVLVGASGVLAQSGGFASDSVASTDTISAPEREWAFSVRWENDTFGGTDRFYTDGIALGVSHTGPSWLDPLADWLPWGEGRRTVSYDVAQGMFTPSDTDLNPPDPNDRPYAGILAFGLTLHVEKEASYHGLKFVTGVVGPASQAKETQDFVHDLIGNGKSQGWDHQLDNEPIFNFAYEYRHKFHLTGQRERWSAEALPVAGGWLGNMLTQGEVGGLLRAGYNMPDDFGPSLVRGMGFMPPPRNTGRSAAEAGWGFSVYGGAFGNFVLRDITLDGNTWEDSPSVDKKFFAPAAGVGMSVGNRRIQVSFSYVFWGKEFDGQEDYSKFGSLSIGYLF